MGRKKVTVLQRSIELSNLEKVFYPSDGFTKARVLDYYRNVSPWLLGHLRMRPLTLKRYPDGVEKDFFYQKQCPAHRPPWTATAPVTHSEGKSVEYCEVNDLPSLMWVQNMASIELHVLLSRAPAPKRPTMVLFDLDPGTPAGLLEAADISLLLHRILKGIGLDSWVKVSGKKGLHCCVPLNVPYSFDQTKSFARTVAQKIESRYPDRVTTKIRKEHRGGKVFIDWSQNDEHKTVICAYSLRAEQAPFVSAPVSWDEVQHAVDFRQEDRLRFHAKDMLKRLQQKGDLFEPTLTVRQFLPGTVPLKTGSVKTWSSAAGRRLKKNPASSQLADYREKRDFSKTPEPPESGSLKDLKKTFVIQKHRARVLHYDFRLECGNVLKSWAVPKGPSLDPATKRLAVEVEDHPLEYARFEGRIPSGEYGAGSVIVWDYGTYSVPGNHGSREKTVRQGLEQGHLEFILAGIKLQGQFLLVRTRKETGGKTQWLLMKKKDSAAQTYVDPLTTDPYSVKSGLWIEDLADSGK